jgi:protein-tyrosine-phosphatase
LNDGVTQQHPALDVASRAARHGALSDPARLTIVDELSSSDRSPSELRRLLGIESNLLAHHLDALERVGLIERSRSSGDGRRRYVHLYRAALADLAPLGRSRPRNPLFVCTRNSARSQLAAALWNSRTGDAATSAGTHPADAVAPGAIAAAARAGLSIGSTAPSALDDTVRTAPLVITVCDQAHEEIDPPLDWLHWSIADPVPVGSDDAFDATVAELRERIAGLTA